ncbi:MAG: hypothetical protein R3E84_01685 [Pseudomonadales bacterium]
MTLPNVLIAGAMKAGTTSAFRYLAQHPEVSASSARKSGTSTGAEAN